MDEELERGRKLITRLELIQYQYFNGRPIWTTIELNDLKLFMAYSYFGYPFTDSKNDENLNATAYNNIFEYYKKEEKKCILNMLDIIKKKYINGNTSDINVGFTFTHSICKMKCNICHNFPKQDVHLWKLLRIKLDMKVIYIDLLNKRSYEDWKDYVDNNTLPKGNMFFPKSGYYEEATYLITQLTPCSKDSVLNKVDLAGKSMVFASGVMMAGSLIFPILSPVLIPSAVAIGAGSAWEIGRTVTKLVDLNQHNQSLFDENAAKHWTDLTLATLGLITAPLSVSIRMLELSNSVYLANKIGKSLIIARNGVCITHCTLGIISLIESVRTNNTLKGLIALRLDIFIVIGQLLPILLVEEIAKYILSSIGSSQIINIVSKFPYILYQQFREFGCFIQKHLAEFAKNVFKFVQNKLTLDKCMFAWKNICGFIQIYNTQILPMLNGPKLLNHIVNDLGMVQQVLLNESVEEVDRVKLVLCGEEMVNVMVLLDAGNDKLALQFYIERVLEDAKAVRTMYEESLKNCTDRGVTDLHMFNAEFCKQFDLKVCRMDEYVLHCIQKAALDVSGYMEAYRLYSSMSENNFSKLSVFNSSDGMRSIDSYVIPAPCRIMKQDDCVQFAQTFDSQNNEYTNYQYTQPLSNGSILYSISAFSVKIVFFYASTIDGIESLNIIFTRDSRGSINRRLI